MKKIKIHEQVCRITNPKRPITFGDIYKLQNVGEPFEFDPEYYVISGHEEEEWTENTGNYGYYYLTIYREREEADDEYKKRVEQNRVDKEEMDARNYQHYLKLKEKYEGNIVE